MWNVLAHVIRWLFRIRLLSIFALGMGVASAEAASVAAKNKEGNRLFAQGKYQEAEKSYLDAQLEAPGRPELLYNLGNTLVKQKKFAPAIQSLRQAVSKGDRGLQASGWYNLGNALFGSGRYQDAAQAYIQALHVNPADKDTKHNLELAWKKLQEQKQNSPDKNQRQDQQNNAEAKQNQQQNQSESDKKDQAQSRNGQQERDRRQDAQSQPSQAERREGSISKERALQILDAMKNQELDEQRKILERQGRRKTSGKDW